MVRNRCDKYVLVSVSLLFFQQILLIRSAEAGNGLAEVVIVNPRKQQDAVPVSVKQTAPGKFRCEYVPREPGLHSVNVLFAGRPVPNSPYGVNVAPCKFAQAI